uniref:Uncharacterized protein n=1 Tax=Oryza punctata TaxID=4537 RepID=A0A0E0JI45_ORYPU
MERLARRQRSSDIWRRRSLAREEDGFETPREQAANTADARVRPGGGVPARRERKEAGTNVEGTGRLGKGQNGERGGRGSRFIGSGEDPPTGEAGVAPRMAAGGHGRWPGMARPFREIEAPLKGKLGGIKEYSMGIKILQ